MPTILKSLNLFSWQISQHWICSAELVKAAFGDICIWRYFRGHYQDLHLFIMWNNHLEFLWNRFWTEFSFKVHKTVDFVSSARNLNIWIGAFPQKWISKRVVWRSPVSTLKRNQMRMIARTKSWYVHLIFFVVYCLRTLL